MPGQDKLFEDLRINESYVSRFEQIIGGFVNGTGDFMEDDGQYEPAKKDVVESLHRLMGEIRRNKNADERLAHMVGEFIQEQDFDQFRGFAFSQAEDVEIVGGLYQQYSGRMKKAIRRKKK
jgi:hypothetical protein